MTEKIIILDAGSQVTQLIGRRLRELNVYCEIYPYNKMPNPDPAIKGVIISGSPCSVRDANALRSISTGLRESFHFWEFAMVPSILQPSSGAKWTVH